jgi:hypothetical protein
MFSAGHPNGASPTGQAFELRTTVGLCRLWQRMGKAKRAKSKLAKVYRWFTEGFDTPDVKQAKALLDELS